MRTLLIFRYSSSPLAQPIEPKGSVKLRNFLSNLSRNGWQCSVASCRGSVCYWGHVTLCNFCSNLSRNAPRNEKQEVCACAHAKAAVKLRDNLLEGWYTVRWCCQLLQSFAKRRTEFYFVQLFAQQKIARQPTGQFSSNLSRNGIARQVAEKIAQCNRALTQPRQLATLKLGSHITQSRRSHACDSTQTVSQTHCRQAVSPSQTCRRLLGNHIYFFCAISPKAVHIKTYVADEP